MANYHNYNSAQFSWQSALEAIQPNISGLAKKFKVARTAAIVGIAVFFIAFVICGITAAMNFNFFIVFIPFFGFGACGVLMAVFAGKEMIYRRLNEIILQIKAYDKVLIPKLLSTQSEAEMAAIVNKLIVTGNLPGYRMIANIMVAKEDVYVSETDARDEYDRYKGVPIYDFRQKNNDDETAVKYCPSCGNKCKGDDRYCSKCGRII